MLRTKLPDIKGRLLDYFAVLYSSMYTQNNGEIDYEDYYEGAERCFKDIFNINSVSDLDVFCEDWGLNDLGNDFEFTFFNLAKKYLALPEAVHQGLELEKVAGSE